MDEFLNVHVSEAGRGKGLGYLDSKKFNLRLDEQNSPSRKILSARCALFLDRTWLEKRRRKHITAFTVSDLHARRARSSTIAIGAAIFPNERLWGFHA